MQATLSLIRREFTAYFLAPVGYVALVLFLIGMGWFFWRFDLEPMHATGPRGVEFPMQGLVGNVGFWLIFWVIPPLLTMRLFAEERAAGTLEMLLTAPVRDTQVVLCKFLACLAFYVLLWAPTLVYLPILLNADFHWPGWTAERIAAVSGVAALAIGLIVALFATNAFRTLGLMLAVIGLGAVAYGIVTLTNRGEPFWTFVPRIDPMPVATTYFGLLLAGAMFVALGLWVSSLVRSPIVAALLSLAVNLVFILGGLLAFEGLYAAPIDVGGWWDRAVHYFSVPLHFAHDFSRGVIDSRNLVLYLSVTAACLYLTVRSLERRRWQ